MSGQQMTVAQAIQATEERFLSIAPQHIKYDAEKGFAIQLLKNNDYLMKVATGAPESLQQALTNVAAIGLSLNPAEKLAYLIPRNMKVGNQWVSRIFLEVSYVGFVRLATDSGSIKWVQAYPVYQNDSYADNGAGNKPTHTFNPFAKMEDRGEFLGVYCVAKTIDGDYLTTTMSAEDVHSIRARSESYKSFVNDKKGNGGPWVTDFIEQAKKSVIRRAFKTWPRTDERRMQMLANAVELSNQNEGFEPIVTSPEIRDFTADQKHYFDQLVSNSDKLGMYVFLSSIEETVRNNLYHSFEKGKKGKYQQIVDELYKQGAAQMMEIAEVVEEAAQSGDDLAITENIEGMTNDAFNLLMQRLSVEAASVVTQLQNKE